MPIETYIFWQNILSMHQASFIAALAQKENISVYVAYEEDIPDIRKEMGWIVPDYGKAIIYDVRNSKYFDELCAIHGHNVCHVFGSYFILHRANQAFKIINNTSCKKAWITEAFDFYGVKGWLRLMRCRWHVWKEVNPCFDYVFAMGQLGVRFFSHAGVNHNKLFEFAYLSNKINNSNKLNLHSTKFSVKEKTTFLYVGQLIHRKGIDLLLQAASKLPNKKWQLLLIGEGAQRKTFESLVTQLGLDKHVTFLGNQSNQAAQLSMQEADVLILPSRWDGWGAVVNEALLAGCPVIVSDSCGAASLIKDRSKGFIFPRGKTNNLADLLNNFLSNNYDFRKRAELSLWSQQVLSPSNLASYFHTTINKEESNNNYIDIPWNLN